MAVAANVGWRMHEAPLYMKLDNDIIIQNNTWFLTVYEYMQKVNPNAPWAADFGFKLDRKDLVPKRQGFYGECHNTLIGGAIIIPQTVSQKIGYWSEDYGLYGCEDGDYGVRVRNFDLMQYYYDHSKLMSHEGHDLQTMKDEHQLDKTSIKNHFMKLFQVNNYLYCHKIRPPSVPPQYIPASFDGYILRMQPNKAYEKIWEASLTLNEIFHRESIPQEELVQAINNFIYINNNTWEEAQYDAAVNYSRIAQSLS